MISRPVLPLERKGSGVNEGPCGIQAPNGTHYIVYSASNYNTEGYALGALRLAYGSDLLDAESWTKLPDPLWGSDSGLA